MRLSDFFLISTCLVALLCNSACTRVDGGGCTNNKDCVPPQVCDLASGQCRSDEGDQRLGDPGLTDGDHDHGDHLSPGDSVSGPVCGNGLPEAPEECDDGNTETEACAYGLAACTICDATCRITMGLPRYCGDGILSTQHEVCDDGHANSDDYALAPHCRNDCQGPAPACGDGLLQADEVCDDGNQADWDGCRRCNPSERHLNLDIQQGDQRAVAIASWPDGSYAVVWQSNWYRSKV